MDAKKKELVGTFKNGAQEWQPAGHPVAVNVHDFPSQALGRASPYGVYDLSMKEGLVSAGTDHDTATFAVETIRRWWQHRGAPTYPGATELLITANGGGSNSRRSRLWKVVVQRFVDETGLRVRAALDPAPYPTKQQVSNDALARVQIHPAPFHGEWNYTISPTPIAQRGAVI